MTGWGQSIDLFGEHLVEDGRAPATVTGYVRHVEWLAQVAADPWRLTSTELLAWLDGQNWSRATRRKVLVSLRVFYAWAVLHGLIEWAPTAGLPTLAAKQRGPRALELPRAWREPFEAYHAACRSRGQSKGTIQQHRHYLRLLAMCAADPWRVTTEQLEQWVGNPDWSPETKRAARSHARAFYRWAVKVGRLEVSPGENLESVHVPRAVPRPAPDDALREALAAADDRMRLAVKLGALAGLRCAEIASLHASQVTPTHLIITGKGGHQRIVPLHPDLATELQVELDRRRRGGHGTGWRGRFVTDTGYLFPSDTHPGPMTSAHMGKLIGRVLPDDWTAHTLRHRFASAAYLQQRDLLAVQTLLGHQRPETTSRYAAVPDGALLAAVHGLALP